MLSLLVVAAVVTSLIGPAGSTDGAAEGKRPGGQVPILGGTRFVPQDRPEPHQGSQQQNRSPSPKQPNVVVVVMDDVSMDLVPTMGRLARLAGGSAVYRNAFVVNTLCCPSRAATFTGQPPHLNGVLTNTSGGPLDAKGGYEAFASHDGPQRSYNVALQDAGYRTGFVGKYLNEYEPGRPDGPAQPARSAPPVVPGWTDFESVSGGGYDGWGFYRTSSGGSGGGSGDGPGNRPGDGLDLVHHPAPPASAPGAVKDRSYAGTVIADRAVALARHYEKSDEPYLLHVAPYAAHARIRDVWPGEPEPIFPPAFADRPGPDQPQGNCGPLACDELTTKDLPGYGDDPTDNRPTYLRGAETTPAPSWRPDEVAISREQVLTRLRDRARMVQSVDRMLGRLLRTVGPDTYVVVTSDNGFHLGQYGLNGGKGTPYAADTRVPLVVSGPDVEPGPRSQLTSSIDLASTVEDLAGLEPEPWRAGRSIVPSLREGSATGSRYTFFEHRQGPVLPGEPDADPGSGGRLDAIPSYVAVRSEQGLLVRLDLAREWGEHDWAWELYPAAQPYEARNEFAALRDRPWVRDLRSRIEDWQSCRPQECRQLTR